ncbi:MAG: hypothetical protein ACI97A_002824 [Planctomycetota bacterium]|jgi:hypothetical protein
MNDVLPQLEDLRPLLPGIGTASCIFLLALWCHRSTNRQALCKVALWSIPAAVFVTWWNVYGEFPWPPRQSTERALWLILIAPMISLVIPQSILRGSHFSSIIGFAAITGPIYYLLRPLIETTADSRIAAKELLLFVLVVLFVTAIFAEINRTKGKALLVFGMGLSMVSMAQVFVIYGIASLAQLLGSAGAALLVLSPLFLFLDLESLFAKMIFPIVMLTSLFTLDAISFGDSTPPLWSLATILGLPTLALLEPALARTPMPTWMRRVAIMGCMVALMAWTVQGVFNSKPVEEPNPYSDYEDWDK